MFAVMTTVKVSEGSVDKLAGGEFQAITAQFAEKFDGPPTVSINEILVQM